MSWMQDWLTVTNLVIRDPKAFFADMGPVDEFEHPLKYGATTQVFIAFFSAVAAGVTAVSGGQAGGMVMTRIGLNFVGNIIQGIVGLFISSGVLHIFVALLGGSGYKRTFAVVAYTTAIGLLVSAVASVGTVVLSIPGAGGVTIALGLVVVLIVLGLIVYVLYAQIIGIKQFHDISGRRAAIAVLLPVIIALILVILMVGAFIAMMGAAPAQPPTTPPMP